MLCLVIAYRVEVYTGSLKGSETSATIFFQMFGSRGDSGRRRLFRSQNDVKFQAGQMDAFEIQAISLDEIRKVVIGHRCHKEGLFCTVQCYFNTFSFSCNDRQRLNSSDAVLPDCSLVNILDVSL